MSRSHLCLSLRRSGLTALAVLCTACADRTPEEETDPIPSWGLSLTPQTSGTEALLQAVSPVSDDVVWVSGHAATYAVTSDGGSTWAAHVVPDADGLQFRDVAAFSTSSAYLMSAGTGDASRIYRTDDGGDSWTLQYVADHPDAFLDCFDFWDESRGLAYGDAIDGVPFILMTEDGGRSWGRVPSEGLPAAQEGEGGFAASGTCLTTGDAGLAWIATGNGERARVLNTENYGQSWRSSEVPVVGGSGSGLTTVQLDSRGVGVALGGVIGQDSVRSENVAVTTDFGATWQVGGSLAMEGPVYGSALVEGVGNPIAVVAVGPRGLDWSSDGGQSWQSSVTLTFWAVAFASPAAGWAVGPNGRIVKLAMIERGDAPVQPQAAAPSAAPRIVPTAEPVAVPVPAVVESTRDTVVGRLVTMYTDPDDETSQTESFFAADSAGTMIPLLMRVELLTPLGGPTRLNRSWLRFIGRVRDGESEALEVESVERISG